MKKKDQHVACDSCALDNICRPIPIGDGQTLSHIIDTMERRKPLASGDALYLQSDDMDAIFAVTSGTLKLVKTSKSGHQQIVGFRFPGELLGDEAISHKKHNLSAVAINEVSACKILMKDIEGIAKHVPSFQNSLMNLISHQCYVMHQQFAAYVARNSAEERLAAFLLNTMERNSTNSDSNTKIRLAMSRSDIANFLGLRHETLSRIFSKFDKSEFISIKGKSIEILNIDALRQLMHD